MRGPDLPAAAPPLVRAHRRLEQVLHALAAAPMDADMPRVVVEQAVAAAGSQGGVACGLAGDRVVVLAGMGRPPGPGAGWGPVDKDDLTSPLTDAVTSGEPVWLAAPGQTRERFPWIIGPRPEGAFTALPLRAAAGTAFGVLGLSFTGQHEFSPDEQEFLRGLADVCGVHLDQWQQLRSQERRPTSAAALGRLVLALSGAGTADEVARVIAEEGATAAAAAFANIALLDDDDAPSTASLLHASTLAEDLARRYPAIGVDDTTPLGTALRSGREVWLRSLTDIRAHYAALLADTVAAGLSATASLPLRGSDGRLVGAMGLGWAAPQAFGDDQRDEIRVVARLAADALGQARQRDRLERLTRALDDTAHRLSALQKVTAALATAVTTDDIARIVVRDGVALLADHGVVALVDAHRRVLRTWAGPGRSADAVQTDQAQSLDGLSLDGLSLDVLSLDADVPIAQAVRTDLPVLARSEPAAPGEPAARRRSTLAVPAHADGRPVGALSLHFTRDGAIDDQAITFATTLADLMGQALQRGVRYEHHAHVAEVLQRSLLPGLPDLDGLELAAVYAPADRGAQVGGDWYEVIDLGHGRSYLVIGDVMGHDIRAAAVMGQLRAAVHCYASIGYPPAQVLGHLHQLVDDLDDIDLVTCLCAVHDAPSHRLTLANAGHPPPLMFARGRPTSTLPLTAEPPLGAGPGIYHDQVCSLEPDTVLALFTDGLVERRAHSIDEGIARLGAFLDAGRDRPLADLARAAVADMAVHTVSEDDAALLLLRVGPGRTGRPPRPPVATAFGSVVGGLPGRRR